MRRAGGIGIVLCVACGTPAPNAPSTESAGQQASPDADSAPDAIDRLVAGLAQQPLWNDGRYLEIDLPKTARHEDVVARLFRVVGAANDFRMVETRSVRLGADPVVYEAIRLETGQGPKIALIRYEGPSAGWWTRLYDSPSDGSKQE
jgi:hypothetical protein